MKTSKKLIGMLILALFFAFAFTSAYATEGTPNDKMGVTIKQVDGNQKLRIQLYNLLNLPTKIKFRTSSGKVIYRENIKDSPAFAVRLDLSRLPPGEYTISVGQEGKRITQHLNIEAFDIVLGSVETLTITAPVERSLALKPELN